MKQSVADWMELLCAWEDFGASRLAPKIFEAADLCFSNPFYERVTKNGLGTNETTKISVGSLNLTKWKSPGAVGEVLDIIYCDPELPQAWRLKKVFCGRYEACRVITFRKGIWLEQLYRHATCRG